MKNPYIDLERIEFVVTYNCTGRCIHCSEGDMINRPGMERHVRAEAACEAIRRLSERFRITSIMTFGGEPLLYPEVVSAIHSTARECGIDKRDIITNGYFSRDHRRIEQVAEMLADAGVSRVLLSVDAFHQQTIPLEPVRCFANALKGRGAPELRLSPAWLVSPDADNQYNVTTRELLASFEGIPVSSGNTIFMAGNAAKYLPDYYPPAALDMDARCGSMPYTTPPDKVSCVSIVPWGDLMVCGFVIGNIYHEPVDRIIDRYAPRDYPLMSAAAGGVKGLLEFACSRGITVDASGCYSICDLCRRIGAGIKE